MLQPALAALPAFDAPLPAPAPEPTASFDLLLAALESADLALVVTDPAGRALYMNAAARVLVGSPIGVMPPWLGAALPGLRHQLARHAQATERVTIDDLALRVRARGLPRPGAMLLELTVASGSASRQVAEQLARGLGLAITDAKLLALLWRGLSNEEIAGALGVRTGTIKSRLFRLYHRLGVKKRPAAVLRAQEVLAAG